MLSLIESAKPNAHDPWAYLKDVFERLPTLMNRDLELLLPHNWRPAKNGNASAVTATATTIAPATVEPSASRQHSRHRRFKVGSRNAYALAVRAAGLGEGRRLCENACVSRRIEKSTAQNRVECVFQGMPRG